jgi:hypothetical protein|tara:strand:- start:16 stop:153 length:138 start_codon:yes stop_codon:yes gene_type:complete
MKKKKLNSKNPKYMEVKDEPKIRKKILMCETKGVKVYGVWYENEN